MSFSFEFLSEGSLVFVGNPFLLDWTGVHFTWAIHDSFTDTEYLFLARA